MKEMRVKGVHSLIVAGEPRSISHILHFECFSTLKCLLRVTAYVLRLCDIFKTGARRMNPTRTVEFTASEIATAEAAWIRKSQIPLKENKSFNVWKKQFELFLVEGTWQC